MRHKTILGALALSISISAPAQTITKPQGNGSDSPPAAPQLIDPGFESFTPASAPINGWYSDEFTHQGDARFGVVRMTPDATDKVEGKYALRIEQPRVRPQNRGQAFLAQAVRFPEHWKGTRRFDLSAQIRGQNGPVLIHIYVWDTDNTARVIAYRKVSVTKE